MIVNDRRVRMICGHYGSGKTEFALNYVTRLVKLSNKKVALSDMDIVNVYFRSREKRQQLIDMGIRVYDSSVSASADLPAIPAEMMGPFMNKSFDYVVDLGGNDVGTVVLGRFKPHIDPSEVDMFMIINIYRPDTCTVEKILEQKDQLEYSSGFPVTGFVNNTNLTRETTASDLLAGEEMISQVSKITNIPIRYTSYVKEVVKDMTPEVEEKLSGEIMPLDYYMRESWM